MRGLFSRGPEVPRWVTDASLARGERVLAATEADDGTWLVGTRDRLHIVHRAEERDGGPAELSVRSVPWERVQHADWDRETERLQVQRVEEYGAPVHTWSFGIPEPGALLALLRERVTASVVVQRRVDVAGKRGFTVIGRRPPAGGDVEWAYEFDAGVDPRDPAVMAAAQAALVDVQESLGLR